LTSGNPSSTLQGYNRQKIKGLTICHRIKCTYFLEWKKRKQLSKSKNLSIIWTVQTKVTFWRTILKRWIFRNIKLFANVPTEKCIYLKSTYKKKHIYTIICSKQFIPLSCSVHKLKKRTVKPKTENEKALRKGISNLSLFNEVLIGHNTVTSSRS
jgi:hypothetical protein